MPVASEPIAKAVAQVTERTPLTTPCETPRSSAPRVESGYSAVAMIVKAGDGHQQQELRRVDRPVVSNAGMMASATAAPTPTRSGPMRWALRPARGPEIAPNAAPIHERGADVPRRHAVTVQVARNEQIDRAQ